MLHAHAHDAGSTDQAATRDRLIEAAGEVFAERGFKDATVREICARAGANVAAVNYHFGDKTGLYRALLKASEEYAQEAHPLAMNGIPIHELTPRDKLRAFVMIMVERMMAPGKLAWHGRLMAREMVEPTEALDEIVERAIRPKMEFLCQIVREVLGAGATRETVEACARSVVGQILLYRNNRPVVERLFPHLRYDQQGMREVAEHVAAFSLAAIENLANRKGNSA